LKEWVKRVNVVRRSISFAVAMLLAPLLGAGSVLFAGAENLGVDLKGNAIRDLAGPGVRAVVLIFAASDCPISNRYVPEIVRLNKEFSANARIWWVFPNPGDTATIVTQHNREFAIHEDTLLDPLQALVERAHATTTPEAAVFLVKGQDLEEVYRGRIDDRYISLGQERPEAQHHDLEAAIRAALDGRPVPQPGGPPVGCSIVFLQK
jgi:hypothetical protein